MDNCDPWLSNFQKILTDGDPDQTGTKKEAAFQSFVPNLVQVRGRVATGDSMKDLQPVRLGADNSEQQTGTFAYTFFVPDTLGVTPSSANLQGASPSTTHSFVTQPHLHPPIVDMVGKDNARNLAARK